LWKDHKAKAEQEPLLPSPLPTRLIFKKKINVAGILIKTEHINYVLGFDGPAFLLGSSFLENVPSGRQSPDPQIGIISDSRKECLSQNLTRRVQGQF
jgi:hypothetical protein